MYKIISWGSVVRNTVHNYILRKCGKLYCTQLYPEEVRYVILYTLISWGSVVRNTVHSYILRKCGKLYCTQLYPEEVW